MDQALITDLRRRLAMYNEGVLIANEVAHSIRFVLDPATGQPVFPAPGDALLAVDATLHVPGESPDALQLLGTPIELDPARHEACDRYLIYFQHAERSRWAMLEIEGVRAVDEVVDGAEFIGEHALRAMEPALCRRLNLDADALARACAQLTGTAPEHPVAVGVDPFGISVRGRFGVLRASFASPIRSREEASGEIERLLGGS